MRRKKKICEPFDKLKGRMREKKYSQEKLSEELSLSIVTLNRKLNGLAAFSWTEIDKLLHILDIPDKEIGAHFFPSVFRNRNRTA